MSRLIRKSAFKKQNFYYESDHSISDKENNLPKESSQTVSKKLKNKNKFNDSVMGSTATLNPVPKTDDKKKPVEICNTDSESNKSDNETISSNELVPEDTSSSESNPEDRVPQKIKTNLKESCQSKAKMIKQLKVEVEKKKFIASLSKDIPLEEADFKAVNYRVKYNSMKEELSKELYELFNEKVFSNHLPSDMPIEWNSRLSCVAGKYITYKCNISNIKPFWLPKIIMATKILDSPDRLRDTLIHEMCHAATHIISRLSDGHGCVWRGWANHAMKVFPELPPISQYHSYKIYKKYTYKCTSCGNSIGRHSKSIDLNTTCCGYCRGRFELLVNEVTKDGTVQEKRELSGFALYVEENYCLVKKNNTSNIKHSEVMKILSQQFSALKLTSKSKDKE